MLKYPSITLMPPTNNKKDDESADKNTGKIPKI
jgi:hypothetical protein